MDIAEFYIPTQLFLSALMFIGASPSSVGGGIRTTTFAIIILTIYTFARGRSSIKIFGREIDQEDMLKSFIVISVAIMLTASAVIFLTYIEPFPLIIFEVARHLGRQDYRWGLLLI